MVQEATVQADINAAGPSSAVASDSNAVSKSSDMPSDMPSEKPKSAWQRHRIAIVLGVVAVCLYLGSIVWMVYGRGQI